MERVVKRSDWQSDDSSPPSPEVDDVPIGLSAREFEYVNKVAANNDCGHIADEAQDDELDFCLFAPTSAASRDQENVAKIRIGTPEPASTVSGFVIAQRPEKYYFAGLPSIEAKRRLELSAVAGQDILAQSKRPWPGATCNWKVIHVPEDRKQRQALAGSDSIYRKLLGTVGSTGRKRKGKTARIKLRKQIASRKLSKEREKQAAEDREALDREKRTRRNREKKVKKKLREKAKKQDSSNQTAQGSDLED